MKRIVTLAAIIMAVSSFALPAKKARIDLRNLGGVNGRLEIMDKGTAVYAETPEWMKNGVSFMFTAKSGEWQEAIVKLKMTGGGHISASLMGPGVHSKSDPKKLEQLEVEYSLLKINDKVLFDAKKTGQNLILWHNKPARFNYHDGADGDVLIVTIKYRSPDK